MKKIFSFVASVLCATALMAQEPVITFEKETHDFGKINEADGRVTTVFNFKNEGMTPLVLSNVKASCGCTTPKWPHEPIEPGATGAITVTYNPNGRPGKFSKTITINSNAKEATMRLYIKGEVIPKPAQPVNKYAVKIGELSLVSNHLDFGDIIKNGNKTKTIEYANQTANPIAVEVSQLSHIDALVSLSPVDAQKSGELSIRWDAAKSTEYGPVKSTIYLTVNGHSEKSDAYAITLSANIVEDFSGLSEGQKLNAPIADIAKEVHLGVLPAGKGKVAKTLAINNAGVNPLYIRRIVAPEDMQFPVLKNGIKSGKKEIKFTINTTDMVANQYQRTITVITNDPVHPVQTISLFWEVQ